MKAYNRALKVIAQLLRGKFMPDVLAATMLSIAAFAVYADPSVDEALSLYGEGKKHEATGLMTRLAEEVDPIAQHHLATQYYFGLGVERDIDRARTLWKKSCDGKFLPACTNYAVQLEAQGKYAEAENLYIRSAEGCQDTAAIRNLIDLYSNAEWSGKSTDKAQYWADKLGALNSGSGRPEGAAR